MQHIGISVDGYAVTGFHADENGVLIGQDSAGQPIEKSRVDGMVESVCIRLRRGAASNCNSWCSTDQPDWR
jgi:hypothetical protein